MIFGNDNPENIHLTFERFFKKAKFINIGVTTLKDMLRNSEFEYGSIAFTDLESNQLIKIDDYENIYINLNNRRIPLSQFVDDLLMATIEIRKDMLNMLIMSFYEVLLDIESVEKIECDSIRIVLDNTFTLKFPARNLPMFLYPQNRYQDIIIPIDNLGNMQIQFLTSKQEITEISEGVSVFDSESMDSFATKPLINLYNNITSEYGEPARTNWSSYKNRLILMENPHKDNKHYSTPAGEMSLIQLYTNAVNTILISHRK